MLEDDNALLRHSIAEIEVENAIFVMCGCETRARRIYSQNDGIYILSERTKYSSLSAKGLPARRASFRQDPAGRVVAWTGNYSVPTPVFQCLPSARERTEGVREEDGSKA